MKLTDMQIKFGAMFLTVDDTCGYMDKMYPQNIFSVEATYDERSSEYAQELGEGLSDEFKMWKEILGKRNNKEAVEILKNKIPWLFEKTFMITYKPKGSGFAENTKNIRACTKKEALEKLWQELQFNFTVKNVDVI